MESKPIKFKGSYDYHFFKIDENENYIAYEQRDAKTNDFVAYEVHRKYPSGANWFKSPMTLDRVNTIMNTPKGVFPT